MNLNEQARIIAVSVMRAVMKFQSSVDEDKSGMTIEQLQATERLEELSQNVKDAKVELYTFMKEQFPEEYKSSFGNLIPSTLGELSEVDVVLPPIREAVETAFVESGIRKLKDYEQGKEWYGYTTLGGSVALVALAAVLEGLELAHGAGHAGYKISLQSYEDYITRVIQSHLENTATIFGPPPWFK